MDKFNFLGFKQYSDLPLEHFDEVKFSVYVLDKDWNYLFVNKFVKESLGAKGKGLRGKNMWEKFPELVYDSAFSLMKTNTEKGVSTNAITTSPITPGAFPCCALSYSYCAHGF